MPTTITQADHGDSLSGSPEKRLDVTPNGTLWAAIIDDSRVRYFSSTNSGSSWSTSNGSDLDLGRRQDTAVPSFFIDADGYAHTSFVRWEADPQVVVYARGTPRTGGGWSWQQAVISPASGRTGVDSDIVVFRNGTGWVAWVSYDLSQSGGAKVAQVTISSTGALAVAATQHGPSLANNQYQFGSLEFAHTGDGKSPTAAPHILFTVASAVGAAPIYGHKATYSGGIWSWQTPVNITTSVEIRQTTLCTCFDGQYLMVAWAATGSGTINVSEWDPSGSTVTARNPAALPGGTGTVMGISLAIDPTTDDMYLVAYGATIGNIIFTKFTRASLTWSAWATVITRSAYGDDGDVQLVRHPPRDSVDMLYSTGNGPYTIFSGQVTALTRSPNAPTLTFPANGARSNLAAGYTFTWTYSPVSPGDTQQSWAFRRVYGGGPTTEYWNAGSQTWGSSIIWNTTNPNNPYAVPFPPAKWTTGTTYTWSVQTRSATGAASGWAADRTVTASLAPTVVVTAPSGLAYGGSTPLVTWTFTSLLSQRDYQVRVVPTFGVTIDPNDPGPATWDSGVVGSSVARAALTGTTLSNGISYRAYVRCTDTNAVQSDWMYSDFTVSVTPPSGPLVEVLDEVDYTSGVVRVRLDATARSNFLDQQQAVGQTGWGAVTNCTVAAQADNSASQLLASLKLTSLAAGAMSAMTAVGSPPAAPYGKPQPNSPLSFPVVANQPYTAIGSFKSAATIRACRMKIQWYDDDDGTGSLISTSIGDQVNSSTSGYVPGFVSDVAPATAVLARVVVEVLGTIAAAEVCYIGRLSLHPGRDIDWQTGGYAAAQTLRVERSDDGGTTWGTVNARVKPDVYQRVTTYDRLMPFGTPVQYRCWTDVDLGTGTVLTSEVSPTSTIQVDSLTWVIRDPLDDAGEMAAYVTDYQRADAESVAVGHPAGRVYPVVDTEGLQAGTGKVVIYVPPSQIPAAFDLLTRATPMVMQSPAGGVWWVRFPSRDYGVTDARARLVTIDYLEIEATT
jgi:hypothetical protein